MNFISKSNLIRYILKTNSKGAQVYLCSLISGYPSGAICTTELYTRGDLSEDEAMRLICFTNNAGPLFLICAVGSTMLGNTGDGFTLFAIQTFSSLIYAHFSRKKICNDEKNSCALKAKKQKGFCECVKNSVISMVNIGGFIVTICVICRIIIIIFKMMPEDFTEHSGEYFEAGIYFLFEISKSVSILCRYADSPAGFALICASVSWSGICVLLQIKSAIPENFKIKKFVVAKIIQTASSFFLGYAYKSNLYDIILKTIQPARHIFILHLMFFILPAFFFTYRFRKKFMQ